mmetsp:Transcript_101646/g.303295  ORF Transcript_101646/g.303295 Transcript_101646/m.303295 type:complete len:242 (-) Transcript_101646:106-831(-)
MPANNNNDGNGGVLTYREMRAVAQDIFTYERKMRNIRTLAMIGGAVLVIFLVLLGGGVVIFGLASDTEVKHDGSQEALVKKNSDTVISTAESKESMDAAELVDYQRNEVDARGDPDGDWILNASRIAMIKTVSWKEGDPGNETTYVQHVADITRHDGQNTSVEITTKAGHKMIIWDSDGQDNFNVMIRRWSIETQDWETSDYVEVLPEGDEDPSGRGRVVVTLDRPRLTSAPRTVNMEDYF